MPSLGGPGWRFPPLLIFFSLFAVSGGSSLCPGTATGQRTPGRALCTPRPCASPVRRCAVPSLTPASRGPAAIRSCSPRPFADVLSAVKKCCNRIQLFCDNCHIFYLQRTELRNRLRGREEVRLGVGHGRRFRLLRAPVPG
ncbi:hypothetical protein CRX72_06815 [Pantoea sp. BRM17]|nr:hypothetical protein CRX72_06815 [Pantoea sp. BRM17]